MPEIVICDARRTPVGKQNGVLNTLSPEDLIAKVMRDIAGRGQIDPALIEAIYLAAPGLAESEIHPGRAATIKAGFPHSIPSALVDRGDASGLEAVATIFRMLQSGEIRCGMAGGFSSGIADSRPTPAEIEIAEAMAVQWKIPRGLQDQCALESHQKAVLAFEAGYLVNEVLPVMTGRDETPRGKLSIEELAAMPPLRQGGTVTAGNAFQPAKGAVALLICSREFAQDHRLKPLVKILGTAAVGVPPQFAGMGAVHAVEKLLARMELTRFEIGLWELGEYFGSQMLAVMAELDPPFDRVNAWGGALALGHAPGFSGPRMVGTLAWQMRRFEVKYGIAALSTTDGQGQAMLLERTNE
jgi:acetyl-CoA acyltransferase